MHLPGCTRRWIALAGCALIVVTGCSSTDDGSTPATTAPATFTGRAPDEITRPTAEGDGIVLAQPAAPLPDGYVQEEFFIAGTATGFDAVDTPDDGSWTASAADEAAYRTRVIVRRPAAEDFSGTVLVEWFNVSAIEAAPDWAYLSEEIGQEGHVYIGVSAQAQGVEGGETLLEVDLDSEAAAEAGVEGEADASGLKNVDPVRYGTLSHPGDAYAFDIFSQVGRAVTTAPQELLGGLESQQVIAAGESQSAGFLSTLVNAVHPLDPVFDGFLIHSRGANVAPLDGIYRRGDDPEERRAALAQGVTIRSELDVPVFIVEAETDLTLLGYANARQPDTDRIRTWEIAGTAHADAHQLRSIIGGPRDPTVGSLLGCDDPINTGPHHEVLQAALHHLVDWASGSAPPPEGERIELVEADEVAIARDDNQIAIGWVRNRLVDVPVAATIGDPPGGGSIEELVEGGSGICMLFGQTIPFDQATLLELYGTADAYLEAFRASADDAVVTGFLLQGDSDQLVVEAEENAALFG